MEEVKLRHTDQEQGRLRKDELTKASREGRRNCFSDGRSRCLEPWDRTTRDAHNDIGRCWQEDVGRKRVWQRIV